MDIQGTLIYSSYSDLEQKPTIAFNDIVVQGEVLRSIPYDEAQINETWNIGTEDWNTGKVSERHGFDAIDWMSLINRKDVRNLVYGS